MDLEDNEREYLPTFNSLVLFTVPRMHAVKAVTKKGAKRYSIFGWWLEPDTGSEDGALTEAKVETGRISDYVNEPASKKQRTK